MSSSGLRQGDYDDDYDEKTAGDNERQLTQFQIKQSVYYGSQDKSAFVQVSLYLSIAFCCFSKDFTYTHKYILSYE